MMKKKHNINSLKTEEISSEEFRQLFYQLYPKLMAFACRFVDKYTAEDLVQDVFTSYWAKKEKIQINNIHSFFFKWLQNNCLNHIKREGIIQKYKSEIHITEERIKYYNIIEKNNTLKQLEKKELYNLIEKAIQELPPKAAIAFRLCYYEEKTHKEIAEIMNISKKTVDSHLYNSMKFLRNKLKDFFFVWFILFSLN